MLWFIVFLMYCVRLRRETREQKNPTSTRESGTRKKNYFLTSSASLRCAELAAMTTEASPTSTTPTLCVMATAVRSQRAEAASQIFCQKKRVFFWWRERNKG